MFMLQIKTQKTQSTFNMAATEHVELILLFPLLRAW